MELLNQDHVGIFRGVEFIKDDGTANWDVVEDVILGRIPFPEDHRRYLEGKLTINVQGVLYPLWKKWIPIGVRNVRFQSSGNVN